ncbi:MAG: AIPR family protein, partial [Rhodospirillales bacterium]|nr:AIPR family protein [Acetobacter sp.]
MKQTNTPDGGTITVPFFSIRNISSPEDSGNARTVYTGQLPIQAIQGLPTDENVRGYLVEAEGKKRRTKTQVHRAIRDTLDQRPDMFSVLNSGIVIVARVVEIDEKAKVLTLKQASIINGSQTQGEIGDFLKSNKDAQIHVKFELICTTDDALIAEISIARNFQNDVATVSIAGRRGQLDELNERFRAHRPELRLSKSETERPADDNEYIQTEKLLQVLAALMPAELWWKGGEINKVYTYSAKATCLKDFQAIFQAAKNPADPKHAHMARVYQYYLDMCGEAYDLYERWKSHEKFEGTGLRSIIREDGKIKEVPDGIIFPILASLSEFVVDKSGSWKLAQPPVLEDRELINVAKVAYM